MSSCKHNEKGCCKIASFHAQKPVDAKNDACAACSKNLKPRQLNNVTASMAMQAIGFPLPSDKRYLLKEVTVQQQGPGTELKRLVSWFWSPSKKCNRCTDRAIKMNRWGVDKCRRRKDLIVAWLRQSAEKNNLPFSQVAASILIDLAISNAEKKTRPRLEIIKSDRWAVAVTTAPRRECTLQQCVDSIRGCGWEPVVFAEPGSTSVNAETMWNHTRLGVWHNWLNSAKWCLENTKADFILTVQDDSLFHPDSKTFAESILWPAENAAFVSLYTPKHYTIRKDGTVRDPGVNRIVTKSLWGACALIWPREVLQQVVTHPVATHWAGASPMRTTTDSNGKKRKRLRSEIQAIYEKRRSDPSTIANSDTAIGKIANAMGKTMWFVDPSPVQHIARFSTISHGDNSGRRNAWRIAHHERPLNEQVPIKGKVLKRTKQ